MAALALSVIAACLLIAARWREYRAICAIVAIIMLGMWLGPYLPADGPDYVANGVNHYVLTKNAR